MTRVISLTAGEALIDFPQRLPEELKNEVDKAVSTISDRLKRRADTPRYTYKLNFNTQPTLSQSVMMTLIVDVMMRRSLNRPPFESVLYAQELVMVIAHLEVFMTDSVKAACFADPRLLRQKKQMTWDMILECGNWDTLLNNIVEQYSYDFGWKNIPDKVEFLKTKFGLDIGSSEDTINALSEAELLRHLIIHNGGRVSKEYLDRSKRTDVALGEQLNVTAERAGLVGLKALVLGHDIYKAIADKFFKDVERTENLNSVIVTTNM